MKIKLFLLALALAFNIFCNNLQADENQTTLPKFVAASNEIRYFIRLNNGDEISGIITEMVNSPEEGEGFKIVTEIGKATIFAHQIA